MAAIEWPTVTVGDKTLIVRYSLAAQVLMQRRGVDPLRLAELTTSTPAKPNPTAAANVMIVFSACVAENFLDFTEPAKLDLNTAPSADYWSTQLAPGQFDEIQTAMADALRKALGGRRRPEAVPLEAARAS
jgi:hypothetical protein